MTPPTRSPQVKDFCVAIMFLAGVIGTISLAVSVSATGRAQRDSEETFAWCAVAFLVAFLVAAATYWWPTSRRFRSVSTVTAAWGALVCIYYSFFARSGWYASELKAVLIILAAPAAMLAPTLYRMLVDSEKPNPLPSPPAVAPEMEQFFDNMTGLGAAKKFPSMQIPKLPDELRPRVIGLLVVICDRAKEWDPAKWSCEEAEALAEIAMSGRVQRRYLLHLSSHARSAWIIGRNMRNSTKARLAELISELEVIVKEALEQLEAVVTKRSAD